MQHSFYQRGVTTPILIVLGLIIIVAGAAYFVSRQPVQDPSELADELMMEDEVMMEDNEMMQEDATVQHNDTIEDNEAMMQKNTSASAPAAATSYTGQVLAGTSAPLLDFNKTDYDKAVASDTLVVLYYYANWCPICAEEFPKMQAAFDALTTDQVVGFRVNFNDNQTDSAEKALAREHGVAYQHTKVFVKNGQQVLKSPESWEQDRYTAEITKLTNK